MIHQPLGGAQGQATDIEIQANEILHHKLTLNGYLVSLFRGYGGLSHQECPFCQCCDPYVELVGTMSTLQRTGMILYDNVKQSADCADEGCSYD